MDSNKLAIFMQETQYKSPMTMIMTLKTHRQAKETNFQPSNALILPIKLSLPASVHLSVRSFVHSSLRWSLTLNGLHQFLNGELRFPSD